MSSFFDFSQIKPWVIEAGQIALGYYQTQLDQGQKDDYSPVTEADQAVEAFLIEKLQQAYPDYGILAEESGGSWQEQEFLWAIDPIDGTRVFIDGLPLWCISIGLLRNGEPYRGIVYLPAVKELYYTDDAGVPFWNNKSLRGMVRSAWDRNSFICTSSSAHRRFDIDFKRLRAFGAIATHLVYVARGASVAAFYWNAGPWDIAGAQAILNAAGGTTVHLDGRPLMLSEVLAQGKYRKPLLAGHPAVLERLRPRIKRRG